MRILTFFVCFSFCTVIYSQDLSYIAHEPHLNQFNEYNPILTIGEGNVGTIYAGTNNATIYQYHNEEWTNFKIPGSSNNVEEIVGDEDGNLYVAIHNEGLWIRTNNNWKLYNSDNSNYPMQPKHGGIAWDNKTSILWVGTNSGLVKYTEDSITLFNHNNVGVDLIDDEIIDLVLSNDGSLWMISKMATLIQMVGDQFFSQPVGWDLAIFDLSFEKIDIKINNEIVITTSNNGLLEYDGNHYVFSEDYGLILKSIAVDQTDQVWMTNESTLWVQDQNELTSYEEPIVPFLLYEIFVSSNNHVWLGGENGSINEVVQDLYSSNSKIFKNRIKTYPNPVQKGEKLFISLNTDSENIEYSVFDIYGQQVYSKFGRLEYINLDFEAGLYFLVLKSDLRVITKSIIIE